MFLDNQRQVTDSKADELVKTLFDNDQQGLLYTILQMPFEDADTEVKSPLSKFLLTARKQPDWFDSDRINKGQLVFKKYAMPIMTLLGALSLPYCYAGSPGNKALYLSDKMRQSPGKRLADTADFIVEVSKLGSFESNLAGIFAINKTRLIHAIARYYLFKKGNWQMQWGAPINQEDMAGTNLAFSFIILNGLQKSAFILSDKEKEDFLFLWRYIGYQLHIAAELLPASLKEASILEEAIRKRNFKKSEEGIALTRELITFYKSIAPPKDAYLVDSQIRYWLGAAVADCIGIASQPVKDALVESINSIKETANFFQVNQDSYRTMLANQKMLRAKISLQ